MSIVPGTSKVVLAVNSSTGSDRFSSYVGGDQTSKPFASIQSAIAALPLYSSFRRVIEIADSVSAYDGLNASGFQGSGEVILSFPASSPSLTGPTSGAAGSGSTTTTCNLPTGSMTNWASDSLRGLFVRTPSSDSDLPYIRPIKSKTDTSFTFDAIPGFTADIAFEILEVTTTTDQFESTGKSAVFMSNSSPVITLFFKPSSSGLDYGIFSSGNLDVQHQGAVLNADFNFESIHSDRDLSSIISNSYAENASPILIENCGTAEIENFVADSVIGSFTVENANSAFIQADISGCDSPAFTLRRCNSVVIGMNANDCSGSSAVLFDSCTSMTQQNDGLTGSGNSGYGAEFTNGGQYNVTGASITGDSGDFSIDGSTSGAQTWANLGTYKAMSRYGGGTLLLAGSTAAEMYILESLLIAGNNFDVSFAQEQHGGRNINYGYFHFATALVGGATADGLTAHAGGGQGSATPCGLGISVFTTVATNNDSAILNTGVIGGMMQVVSNLGVASIDVYPPSGGKIDSLSVNAPLTIGPGGGALFFTRDDGSGGKNFITGAAH